MGPGEPRTSPPNFPDGTHRPVTRKLITSERLQVTLPPPSFMRKSLSTVCHSFELVAKLMRFEIVVFVLDKCPKMPLY